jgi:hypothetical protein
LDPYKHYYKAFIDNVVIFSDNAKDHLRHLEKMFQLFISRNIAINPKKSFIGYPSVELLGFVIDAFGMATTAERIAAFKGLQFPSQLKALE